VSKTFGRALAVALLACSWPALAPAGRAHALGRPCAGSAIHVAIVVDFGDVMSTTSTCIAAGDRDRGTDILHARAQALGTPAPRFNGSGLLCAIDGFPETGCGEKTGDTYAYWSYFHGNDNAWVYSSFGPASWRVRADYVEGWRWQPHGEEGSVPAPRGDPNATATCVPAPPPTEAPAPPPVAAASPTTNAGGPAPTVTPASPTTARGGTRPTTPTTVAGAAAPTTPPSLATEPTTTPVGVSSTSTPSTAVADDERKTEAIAARSAPEDDDGGGSPPTGLILGVVLIAAIGGGAFYVQRRRAPS
jgi:hypothetical protein